MDTEDYIKWNKGLDTSWDNVGPRVVLAAAIAPVFSVIFVALRFYTARAILRTFHKDDWLILVGLLFSIGFSITQAIQTRYGLGQHFWDINRIYGKNSFDLYQMYMIINAFSTNITAYFSNGFIKASIFFFYLRFSTMRSFNITVYIMLGMVFAHTIIGATGGLWACRPMHAFWTFDSTADCVPPSPWYAGMVCINVFMDLVLLMLPIWLLKPLRVGVVQKTVIAGILGTGGFVLGVSIYRLVIVLRGFNDMDLMYRHAVNYIWAIIETNVAIVCACMPTLKALVMKHFPSLQRFMPEGAGAAPAGDHYVISLPRQRRIYNDDDLVYTDKPTNAFNRGIIASPSNALQADRVVRERHNALDDNV